MKSPLTSAILLASAVALFISGALIAHSGVSPQSHLMTRLLNDLCAAGVCLPQTVRARLGSVPPQDIEAP